MSYQIPKIKMNKKLKKKNNIKKINFKKKIMEINDNEIDDKDKKLEKFYFEKIKNN